MKAAITLLFFSIFFELSAQTEIKGHVLYKQTRQPVASATVTVHPVGSASILTYLMTDDEGIFTIRRDGLPDSVTLTVAAMTIEKQSKTVKSNVGFIEILVKEQTIELKEVIVKAPKIRQIGDTLNYSVSSFLDETDRSIGDVLKKLPGIQVLSSGQILYQNKEINKFYIEGLDLLKGKYGLSTQNVDASKVATVQILENHQPIKALKGMEIPENAAINLKLRNSAIGAFFATAQIGAGLPLVLLSNEAVAMRFTRSQQNMLVYKNDNTGRDISRELTSYYDIFGNSSTDFLSVVLPSPPSIREQHHLFNDAHIVSLNDLRSLRKDLTLTSNINFLYDKHKSSGFSKSEIFPTQSDTVLIQEDMNAKLLKRELEGTFTVEENTDDNYLNNTLRVKSTWNTQHSDIVANEPITQNLERPSFYIGNEFDYLRRKDDKSRQVKVSAKYTSQRNSLRVTPVLFEVLQNPDSIILQKVSFDHFSVEAVLSGNKNFKRMGVGYTAGASFNHYLMKSELSRGKNYEPVLVDSLRNSVKRAETRIFVSPLLTYRGTFVASLSLPLNYLFLNRHDEVWDTKRNIGHLLFSPRLVIQHSLNVRVNFSFNMSFSNGVGWVNEDYLGYIMMNYRGMNRSDGLLSEYRRTTGYLFFNYKNPFTTLFTSVQFTYNSTWRNMLYDVSYDGVLSSSIGILHPNTSHNFGIDYSLGKSIDAINSEVKVFVGYNKNLAVVMSQGVISDYTSDSYSISPYISTNIRRFMIVKYGASYRHNHTRIRDIEMEPVNYFMQDIAASLIPTKGLTVTLSFNHYINDMIKSSARSSWFGNVGIRYKMKDVDLMLDWTNIFNMRRFVTYSYSDISRYYSEYELRPAGVLLRVRFKIL